MLKIFLYFLRLSAENFTKEDIKNRTFPLRYIRTRVHDTSSFFKLSNNIIFISIFILFYSKKNVSLFFREVTGFVFIHTIKYLDTLSSMFPYLTIIRGTRLFSNYALVFYDTQLTEVSTRI